MNEKFGIRKSPVRNRMLIYGLLLFIFVSCYAKGPLFTVATLQQPDASLIYIYRPDEGCLESSKIGFLVDSDQVVTLRGNEYSYVQVEPGEHLITSGEVQKEGIPSLRIRITSDEGKSRYVQYKITCESDYLIFNSKAHLYLGGVPENRALREMKNTTLTTVSNGRISESKNASPR